MSNYIVYCSETGEVLRAGEAPDSMIVAQAGEGEAVVSVPPGVIGWPDIDLAPLRQQLKDRLDEQSEEFRLSFITAGSGQAAAYSRKEMEARAWMADSNAETPILSAESAAIGVSISDLAADVIAAADRWASILAATEAARRRAKVGIDRAANIADLVSASEVNWEGLLL